MPAFAQSVIQQLRLLPSPDSDSDIFLKAGDLLSKARMTNFSSGIYPEIDTEGATAEEAAARIQALLVDIVEHYATHPNVGAVLCALAQAREPKLEPLFIEHVKRQLTKLMQAHGSLFQCQIGLENMGLSFETKTKRSEMIAETIDRMDALLQERGLNVPY